MPTLRREEKLICFKIVYCGSALSGKTTNLQQIHERLDPRGRGELVSMNTTADRTLFFDFLPVETELVPGWRTLFQLYTVPGQMIYNATLSLVLQGADGLVFVVDSQADRQRDNVQAMQNLAANLRMQGLDILDVPLVLQYNKRDLPNAAPLEYLEFLFNNGTERCAAFEAEAANGRNVLATLNATCQEVMTEFQHFLRPDAEQDAAAQSGSPSHATPL
jgi:mutual gliding-motility protein MglA